MESVLTRMYHALYSTILHTLLILVHTYMSSGSSPHQISWGILVYHRISQDIKRYLGISLEILDIFSKHILNLPEKDIPIRYPNISWHLLEISLKIFNSDILICYPQYIHTYPVSSSVILHKYPNDILLMSNHISIRMYPNDIHFRYPKYIQMISN